MATEMTFGSVFDGIYGFGLGMERAGMSCLWRSEVDKYCNALMDERRPNIPNSGDVHNVTKETAEPVELICGGFPCTDLSIAGKRAGLAGERSGLWFEFARVIEELKPRWVIIENVPGLLSSNGGRDMGILTGTLAQFGYGWAYRVLDSQFYGVAQRRRRVFIVGSLGTGRCTEVLFERESVSWYPPARQETGQGIAGTLDAKSTSSNRGSQGNETDFIVPYTIQANDGGSHKRQDRPAGGMYVNKADKSLTLGSSDKTVVAIDSRQTWAEPYENVSPNLDGGQSPAVVSFIPGNSAQARSLGESIDISVTVKGEGGGTKPHIAGTFIGVRRLTPTECERLQGFPDGWTDNGQSDTQRYKQLGNAVTVNVAEWIARRIMEVEHGDT